MEDQQNGLKMTGATVDAVLEKNASATFYDAVFGFTSWLTSRSETIRVGSDQNAAVLVELASKFCKKNGYNDVSSGWPKNIKYPKE